MVKKLTYQWLIGIVETRPWSHLELESHFSPSLRGTPPLTECLHFTMSVRMRNPCKKRGSRTVILALKIAEFVLQILTIGLLGRYFSPTRSQLACFIVATVFSFLNGLCSFNTKWLLCACCCLSPTILALTIAELVLIWVINVKNPVGENLPQKITVTISMAACLIIIAIEWWLIRKKVKSGQAEDDDQSLISGMSSFQSYFQRNI